MPLEHLNDEEIQEYLDGNLPAQNVDAVKEHLEGCPVCRDALKQYRLLYDGLTREDGFDLSRDFSKSVVSKVAANGQAKHRFNFGYVILAILGAAIGVGIMVRYMNLRSLSATVYETVRPQFGFLSLFADSVKSALVIFNGNVSLVIISGLVLAFLATLDRFVLKPKYRRVPI